MEFLDCKNGAISDDRDPPGVQCVIAIQRLAPDNEAQREAMNYSAE